MLARDQPARDVVTVEQLAEGAADQLAGLAVAEQRDEARIDVDDHAGVVHQHRDVGVLDQRAEGGLRDHGSSLLLNVVASRPCRWSSRRKLVRSRPASRAPSDTEPWAFSITRTR